MYARAHCWTGGRTNRVGWAVLAAACLLSHGVAPSQAQLPVARLYGVFPPGGTQGAQFDVMVTGADLDEVTALQFTHPGIQAKPKMSEPDPVLGKTRPIDGRFQLSIGKDVPPGIYEVRAAGRYGISNPRAFVVSDMHELVEQEPNNRLDEAMEVPIGTIVNARADATGFDYYRFHAQKGERAIIICWAERIDSRLDSTLVLYDARGRELARNRSYLGSDALLDFTAPADGDYFVKVYDFTYGGGNDYFYRLQISARPHIDFVFPPAALPGTTGPFTLYGRNLPGGKLSDVKMGGRALESLQVTITVPKQTELVHFTRAWLVQPGSPTVRGFTYALQTPQGRSNSVVIGLAAAPIVAEKEPNDQPQQAQRVSVPCAFVGQFHPDGDRDWLEFEAAAGETYWIEMYANRLRRRTDPYLILERVTTDANGQEQTAFVREVGTQPMTNVGGAHFNTSNDDFAFRLEIPQEGRYRIMVRDLYNNGDPRFVYRLSIRQERPDFELVAAPRFPSNNVNVSNLWSVLLRQGGTEVIDVLALRTDGFEGEIQVRAEGLPPGVSCPPVTIGPGQTSAPLVLRASDNAKSWAGTLRIVGTAEIAGRSVEREALGGSVLWPPRQNNAPVEARLTRTVALAVTDAEPAPFTVDLGDGKPLETSRGGVLKIVPKVTRRGSFKGNVALPALNVVVRVNNQNLSVVRGTALTLNANQTSGEYQLTVPSNAPVGTYTFHITASSQVPYERNPEAVAAAEAEKKELDARTSQLDNEAKAAAQAAQDAAKALQAAQAEAQKAQQEAQAAAAKAKQEADNKELQRAAQEAEEALKRAEAAVRDAAQQKEAADQAAQQVQALLNAAKKMQTDLNNRIAALKRDAQRRNINVFFPTTSVTLRVDEMPLRFTTGNVPALKAGGQVEIPVQVQRLYGFADAVTVDFVAPSGVAGLQGERLSLAKEQNAGKLVLKAAANATVGTHEATLRATVRFNNQNLQAQYPVTVKVDAAQ